MGNGGYNNGNNNYPCLGGNCGNSGYNPGNIVTSYPCRGSKCGNSGYNSGNSGFNSGNSGYNSGSNTLGGILSGGSNAGYGSNLDPAVTLTPLHLAKDELKKD